MRITKKVVSIILAILMVTSLMSVMAVSVNASTWTFKLNSNFSGSWAMEDIESSTDKTMYIPAGTYEFEIVAYEDGNISAYRGNNVSGSHTDTLTETLYDNGGHCNFTATGGYYTFNYNGGTGVMTVAKYNIASVNGVEYNSFDAAAAARTSNNDVITPLVNLNNLEQPVYTMSVGETLKVKYVNGYNVYPAAPEGYHLNVATAYDSTVGGYVFTCTVVESVVKVARTTLNQATGDYYDYYTQLQSNKSGTQIVCKDFTQTSRITFSKAAPKINATIDLGGHTVTFTQAASDADSVYVHYFADVTVKNGTMLFTSDDGFYVDSANLIVEDDAVLVGTGSNSPIVIKGESTIDVEGTVTAEDSYAIAGNGLSGNGGYTINIKDGADVSSDTIAIYHPNEGDLNISGGNVTGGSIAVYAKSGTTTVTGGNLEGENNALKIDSCNYPGGAPEASVTGGNFESQNGSAVTSVHSTGAPEVTGFVSGGTFSDEISGELLDNTKDTQLNTETGKYEVVNSANTYVARVGDTRYTSIADAIAAIDTTGTVTVLASHSSGAFSVPAAKTITLDLGGYTVTGSVTNSGTLTVKNGTLAGTSVVIRNAGGTVNVDEDATVTASAAAAYLGYSAGVLNMNGTMEAPDDVIVVQAHAGTKANIAGTVTATNNGTALLGMGPVEIDLKDGANVTGRYGANIQRADPVGPTVTVREGARLEGTAFGITGNGNANNGKTTINILGGTVKGGNAGIYHPQEGTLTISGGTVEGYDGIYMRSGTANITGGTIKGTGAKGDHEDSSGGAQLTGDAFAVDNSDYPGGAPVVSITGGTFISENADAVASYAVSNEQGVMQTPITGFVSGGLFSNRVDADLCAENYFPVSSLSEEGMYVVKSVDDTNTPMASIDDENDFGLACDYLNGAILGVQMKNTIAGAAETSISGQENGNDIRFIAVIDTEILNSAEDYGFVVAKADDKKEVGGVNVDRTCANTNFDGMKYNGGNGEKTLTAVGTNNNVCGNAVYGNPADKTTDYKYVTCAINGVESGKKIVARFYIKVNGKVYYTNYTNDQNQTYTGCVAGVNNGSIY